MTVRSCAYRGSRGDAEEAPEKASNVAAKKAGATDDGNASDFIRAQSMNMTAPLVVEAGKKAGFDFSTSLVYAVRGRMKKSTGAAPSVPVRREAASARPRALPPTASGGGRLEAQLEELVRAFVRDLSALVRRAALDSVREALGESLR